MSTNIHNFPGQNHAAEDSYLLPDADGHSAVQEKLKELQAWTICYNRELLRLTRELNELRSRHSVEAA
jgi:hypothetical protein